MKTAFTATHTQKPAENEIKGKVVKKSGKRIGYNYIILKSLKASQKNDVVKCLYIKSLTDFGFCVIKEGTFGDSKDKEGRDIKDRLVWQQHLHELLQGKVRMPRLLGRFEENGNYYLVLEHIRGKSLTSLLKKHGKELREALINGEKLGIRFLNYLLQVISLLETLHQNHIVHRDATPNNFMITPRGRVVIIDMELSYSLKQQFPSPPFQLGTYGYMSPQQMAIETPTIQEDVFSIGSILIQMWTSISPAKINDIFVADLDRKVCFFIPDQQIAEIVLQCLQPQLDKRPALSTVSQLLQQYKNDLKKKVVRSTSSPNLSTREEILRTVQEATTALGSPLLTDVDRGWFSEDPKKLTSADKNKISKSWYASYNLGAAGIIYALSKIKTVGLQVEATLPSIQKGLDLIEEKYINKGLSASPSLHFGSAGIAAALSTAIDSGLIEAQPKYWDWLNTLLNKDSTLLNISHGIAGQGLANLICAPSLRIEKINERLLQYVQHILNRQGKDGSWINSVKDKKPKITRGFARGMAGIIYFLLEYGQRYGDHQSLAGAERGLYWLMKKAIHKNNAVLWRSASGKEVLPWWCEGSAGIALTFLKAWSILKAPIYRQYAIGAMHNHPEKILDNNLSQCHGLSGLGEIYLEAYHTLEDEKWLERANWIAQALHNLRKFHPEHGIYWLVEHERQPVSNFMLGNSGILHFLTRYCYPDKIGFPLMPTKKTQRMKAGFQYIELSAPHQL